MAAAVIDALAQWDALAEREVAAGYQVKPSSSTASASASGLHMPPRIGVVCALAWREKIVKWCYQVVDHW